MAISGRQLRFDVNLRGSAVPRRGCIAALLQAKLQNMKKQGVQLSSCTPFAVSSVLRDIQHIGQRGILKIGVCVIEEQTSVTCSREMTDSTLS